MKMYAGVHVFVCDNMALSGDEIILNRKHTTRFNAAEALTGAFDRYRHGALVLQQNIEDLRVSTLPEWDAQRELFNIFYRNLLPARFLKPVADSYFSGQDRSTWALVNACTLHAKNLAPGPNMRAHTRLGKYFGLGKDATC